jgi:hypothetical protein
MRGKAAAPRAAAPRAAVELASRRRRENMAKLALWEAYADNHALSRTAGREATAFYTALTDHEVYDSDECGRVRITLRVKNEGRVKWQMPSCRNL